ncbi:hypothetical protein JW851_00570 [Candidatus Woesearchaeota archaeon]|nr:hypothetical protein [Candidatus Woesearchaeota archaeon]
MKIISDLHIHGRYSRATSKQLTISNLEKYARMKGLNLLGTGDFTHPEWFKELKKDLIFDDGVLKTSNGFCFIPQTEISLVYTDKGKGRRIHQVILAPDFEIVLQITEALKKRGRVDYDGRPIFKITSPELVEMMNSISPKIEIIPAHCLLPKTLIHTNYSLTEINKISAGDKVLTHNGVWQKVLKTYNRKYQGDIYHVIPFYFREGIKTTPEHPFLAIKTMKKCASTKGFCKMGCSQEKTCRRKHYLNYSPSWISAKNLENSDILLYPIIKETKDRTSINIYEYIGSFVKKKHKIKPFGSRGKGIKPIIPLNKETCRLIGYYLAEGYTNNRDAIGFCFHQQEKEYINDVINLIQQTFGISSPKIIHRNKSVELIYFSKLLLDFFSLLVYPNSKKCASTKKLPDFCLYLPREKQSELFRGWWRGDAGITSSQDLANQMKMICLRLKIIPSIYIETKEKFNSRKHITGKRTIIAKKDHYIFSNLSFYKDEFNLLSDKCFKRFKTKMNRKHGWIDNNYIYIPIKKIKKEKYSGNVFNLEVEKDNSYLSEFATIHNCWTPWFGMLGSMSGFDSLKECFQEKANKIHAIETGLSSDPAMNWRIKELDNKSILSFSDLHSFWPWRIGRECTIFDVNKLDYDSILKAIRNQEVVETIEFFPEEGKYHYDGHRNCGIVMNPKETKKHKGICPKCGKKLTLGVAYRVEELADREEGYKPSTAKPFKSLIPLSEVISGGLGAGVATQKTWKVYNDLQKLGNEMEILLEVPKEKLVSVCNERIADLIIKNREQKIKIEPGYDGVYGKPIFDGVPKKEIKHIPKQRSLGDF